MGEIADRSTSNWLIPPHIHPGIHLELAIIADSECMIFTSPTMYIILAVGVGGGLSNLGAGGSGDGDDDEGKVFI